MPFWSRASGSQSQPPASIEKDLSSGDDLASSTSVSSGAATESIGGDGALLSQAPPSKPSSILDNFQQSPPTTSDANSGGTEAIATVSEPWTRIFPEAFGIRRSIEDSSFRWCVRESMLWGVATGTVMGIHRLRMKSHPLFAINVAFGTAALVAAPSYYFCFRRREHQENVIEMMMAVNDFRPGEEMPETVPLDENHPFLDVNDRVDGEDGGDRDLQKEFVARLKEKKEWQEPHKTQDADEVFKEVKK